MQIMSVNPHTIREIIVTAHLHSFLLFDLERRVSVFIPYLFKTAFIFPFTHWGRCFCQIAGNFTGPPKVNGNVEMSPRENTPCQSLGTTQLGS